MSSTIRRPLVVIDVVGLTPAMLGPRAPHLTGLRDDGFMAPMDGVLPAVTTTAQASMLTGLTAAGHGIVGNGWYFRDLAEVWFWRQSNRLMQGEKVWETLRRKHPGFTCAKLFWWYNMYSSADWALTPRPVYPADGRKLPALYSQPANLSLEVEAELGSFPFFHFWGPKADIRASDWIADSAVLILRCKRPDLTLVYLPHLDYNLQRLGPDDPDIDKDIAAVDAAAGRVIAEARRIGAEVLVVSEYGIGATRAAVHINRSLREAGLLAVRDTRGVKGAGWELLDPGASRAFAVVDHQIAHVYIADPKDIEPVRRLLARQPGIAEVMGADDKVAAGIDHPRSGELVAVAAADYWFSYYYWLDDNRAPDFARTVDIHRKPGYDPVELFLDPALRWPKLKIAWRLAQKRLGVSTLLDVIPLRPELVRGSHGRLPDDPAQGPVLISSDAGLAVERLPMTGVHDLILRHYGDHPG
ncbi:alkaline phosphatase family protein [Halochromatium glycolicum]|uniref:Alkaline phosphatase family protein n=1 Tax=Halochromatium glycolicum TaxID=85075 RepID=A0AAJ0U0H6_9GAMM|nr:nucleotide pyrophosphatase/phosphodiesterase family protein [Halochromatium glycolicum]MBK1703007.1 alkaline phosphatase family protein [Halochromatium glycolicum]